MRTNEFIITGKGKGIDKALCETERLAKSSELTAKEALRLRLLAEELVGLIRGIAGEVEAVYYVEEEDKAFKLHLAGDVALNQEMRRELLSLSTSGTNQAAKGFMGKLREMIAQITLPKDASPSAMTGFSVGLMSGSSPSAAGAGMEAYIWSMNKYKSEMEEKAEKGEDDGALEELEKSIVASIADEVSVGIRGTSVEVTIFKAFR